MAVLTSFNYAHRSQMLSYCDPTHTLAAKSAALINDLKTFMELEIAISAGLSQQQFYP
jgi:hypothetical protein